MAAGQLAPDHLKAVADKIDQLIALFNRKGMDLPEGLFDRATQFLLNGAPYETLLGRHSSADPLVLMLARGPAGYRFIAKALWHTVPDVQIQRGELSWNGPADTCGGELWLSGHLRGSREPVEIVVSIALTFALGAWIERAEATIDQAVLDKLRAARLAP